MEFTGFADDSHEISHLIFSFKPFNSTNGKIGFANSADPGYTLVYLFCFVTSLAFCFRILSVGHPFLK